MDNDFITGEQVYNLTRKLAEAKRARTGATGRVAEWHELTEAQKEEWNNRAWAIYYYEDGTPRFNLDNLNG